MYYNPFRLFLRGEGGQKEGYIMNFKNLCPIICILLFLVSLGCSSKNETSLKQPQNTNKTSEEFFKAIALLDVEAVSNHLNNGSDVNARKNDKTALMLAIITPYFLPSQEDKEKISSGQSSREDIINEKRKQIIQNLIEKGADIDARNKHNKTALMLAITITKKSFDYRKNLLGFEINVSDEQRISDHGSKYHNSDIWTTNLSETSTLQISQALIEAGANVNLADKYGRTPLMLVAESLLLTTIPLLTQTLIDADANVNATNNSGRTTLIQILAQIEKVPKPINSLRWTMLEKMITILIKAGADLNITDENGRTTLEIILITLSDPNRNMRIDSIMSTLIENVNLNTISSTDRDRLITYIFRNGNVKVAEALFKTNVNLINEDGKTPLIRLLEMAQQEEHIPNIAEMIRLLINAEADVNATDEYGTPPLTIVLKLVKEKIEEIEFDIVEVVRLLIDAEADVNFKDEQDSRYKGWTPLMFASSLPPLQSSP